MNSGSKSLDATFRARALPPGSARYWSHVFAAPDVRPGLLGVYALTAEWHALLDPSSEPAVAQMKLAWWQEEMQRLARGQAVHPISRYLASLPNAAPEVFEPLQAGAGAAMLDAGGVPLERTADLAGHAGALLAEPLRVAVRLARGGACDDNGCTQLLAEAEYAARALREYRLAARCGRIPFPIEELISAGIDNAALAAAAPDAALRAYLERWRSNALRGYAGTLAAMPRSGMFRHLAVLAALGSGGLQHDSAPRRAPLKDMLRAWAAARRANSRTE